MKTENQRAWFFVLPVLLLVAFNALVPIMTVVNYSVQETFGDNLFFWEGLTWFEQILRSDRFHAALGRQFFFTFMGAGGKNNEPRIKSFARFTSANRFFTIIYNRSVSPLRFKAPSLFDQHFRQIYIKLNASGN